MGIKLNGSDVSIPLYTKVCLNEKVIWLADLPDEYVRVDGFRFNNNCYFEIDDFKLTGGDTVRFTFKPSATSNVFGSYTSSSADNNYSLYVSTTTSAKYMRYNGRTYASGIASSEMNTEYDVVVTPTGTRGLPRNDTWTRSDFICSLDMCIATTSPNASSSKYVGELLGNFVVDGRFCGVPCKRVSDNVLGYFDLYTRSFYEPAEGTPTAIEQLTSTN